MSAAAGSVTVVLSANSTSFSAGLAEAQRNLDKFANSSKKGSHGTVSGMQAASASIRLLDNPLGNNVRAIERLITQSKLLSGVLKAAFPLVGAIAIGTVLAKLGVDAVEFIDKIRKMPKAIQEGFSSLNLAQKTSTDELILSTDKISNATAKLLHAPQNDLKTAIDEDRVAMDRFAGSIESSNAKLNDLLSKNSVGLAGSLWGKFGTQSTRGVEKQTKEFSQQSNDAAYDLADSDPGSVEESAANANLKIAQAKQLAAARKGLADAQTASKGVAAKDQSDVIADYKGIIATIRNQQKAQAAQIDNAQAEKSKQAADNAKTLAEQAKQAAAAALEAQKKAATDQLQQWESDNSDWKAAQDRTLLEDAAWWKAKLDTLSAGSLNYKTVNKKVNADVIADNRQYAETIKTFTAAYFKDFNASNGLNTTDTHALNDAGKSSAEYITALRASIDLNRENADAIAESSLAMEVATGRMTRLDAAQAMANLHTQQYRDNIASLTSTRAAVNANTGLSPQERQAQSQVINNQITSVTGQYQLQSAQDKESTNPAASRGTVGFTDSLDEFVIATRDAAGQMREITSNTLHTLNSEFVKGISGQRTDFDNAGASIFRNVASTGIQKAEGSVLGAFGFGGKADGSKGSPLYVRMADTVSGAATSALSGISKGGFGGFLSSIASFIPGFAAGGTVSPGTLAMVGEKGPELAYFGSGAQITPNHQLSSMTSSGGDTHHWNIDARGATDPAQTAAQVQYALRQAAPQFTANAMQAAREKNRRQPTSAQR